MQARGGRSRKHTPTHLRFDPFCKNLCWSLFPARALYKTQETYPNFSLVLLHILKKEGDKHPRSSWPPPNRTARAIHFSDKNISLNFRSDRHRSTPLNSFPCCGFNPLFSVQTASIRFLLKFPAKTGQISSG